MHIETATADGQLLGSIFPIEVLRRKSGFRPLGHEN
jgi:hypothetical protein